MISSVGSCPAQRSAKRLAVARRHRRRIRHHRPERRRPHPPPGAEPEALADGRLALREGGGRQARHVEQVGGGGAQVGAAPGDAGIAPEADDGQPRHHHPDRVKGRRAHPGDEPQVRQGQAEMRVGGQQRRARGAARGRHRHRVAAAPRQPGQDGAQRRAPRIGLLARFGQSRPGFERALPEPREARPAALGQQGEVGEPVDVGARQPPDRQHVGRRVGLGREAEQAEFRRTRGHAGSRGSAPPGRRRRSPASRPASPLRRPAPPVRNRGCAARGRCRARRRRPSRTGARAPPCAAARSARRAGGRARGRARRRGRCRSRPRSRARGGRSSGS